MSVLPFLIAYAAFNAWTVRDALAKEAQLPDDRWALAVTTVAGLVLAVATIILVLTVV